MRLKALLLSIVPGFGHIALGRYAQGVILFTLFAASLNGILVGWLWQGEETARRIRETSAASAALVFAISAATIVKVTLLTDRAALARRRDEALRRGLVHYLRDELQDAERALEEALRFDVDRRDTDVLFHLGVIAKRRGDLRRARRLFRRCLAADLGGKWRFEVAQELQSPPASDAAPAAPPAEGGAGARSTSGALPRVGVDGTPALEARS